MDVYGNHSSRMSVAPLTPISEQLNLEYDERPYLLVDLRDRDEYRTNHIVSGKTPRSSIRSHGRVLLAHHYPAAMLSRCSNNESKELLIYVSAENVNQQGAAEDLVRQKAKRTKQS